MDGDTFGGRKYDDAEILRGDLHRILYETANGDVDFRVGDAVASLTQLDDGVEVVFESGYT